MTPPRRRRQARDVSADDCVLRLRGNDRDVRVHLGPDAVKWAFDVKVVRFSETHTAEKLVPGAKRL